ncbi:hypothetical protein [Pantoea agglomerans]|uniref:hypothetical protein n=1 Tax=Enterobacter agglomerans TaxID=549 RepID=UPI001CBC0E64|nr:hypothetical protein [Pantoea agglomerans]
MTANILAVVGIIVSIVSAYFAYLAYASSREITFPKRGARKHPLIVKNFSSEAKDLHEFLAKNRDRKVYINLLFDGDIEVIYPQEESDQESYSVRLWDERFSEIPQEEKPSHMNCTGVEICIDQEKDTISKFGYDRGNHRLQGQFYIYAYAGPYQGIMSAVLLPVKLS